MVSTQTGDGYGVGTRADFYRWDGSYLRGFDVAGVVAGASVDGAYIVNLTTGDIWSSAGHHVGSIDVFGPGLSGNQGRLPFNWAADGDYFCALGQSGPGYFSLAVEDIAGRVDEIPLNVPSELVPSLGLSAMQADCSLTSNRAIVWEDDQPQKLAVFSLPDGNVISEFTLGTYIASGRSPDLRWLLADNADTKGPYDEVIDTAAGTIAAQFDGQFSGFTPDGQNLVGTDSRGDAAVFDWRTKTELWTGTGHLEMLLASSDSAVNKMVLWLSTGSDQAGTTTYDYWIVDGGGAAVRFTPRGCASSVASAARVCPIG